MNRSLLKDVCYSALAAVSFLLWKGYIFNSADTVEPLLLVYKKLDPTLYTNDFYVESAQDIFTVRYYFVELLAGLGKVFPLEQVAFIGTLLCLFFGFWGILKVARELSDNLLSGYFVPFFVSFFFLSWTVGGNVLQYHLMIASNVAKPLCIWGLYFILRKRYTVSSVLIGLSGLFQILVGLQMALIIISIFIFARKWKTVFRWTVVWLMVALPMLGPIFYRQFFMPEPSWADTERFYHILYFFRNPQHYLPSLFPLKDYLKLFLVTAVGGACLYKVLSENHRKQVFVFSFLILLGMVVYTVMLEILNIGAVGKLQWFKTTIWLSALGAIGIGLAAEKIFLKVLDVKLLYVSATLLPVLFLMKDSWQYAQPIAFDHRTAEQKELSEVHKWIKNNTEKDAVFATYVKDESFSCESKRAQTISLNPMIHEPWFIIEWYERFHKQYGVTDTLNNLTQMREWADQYYESGVWLSEMAPDYCIIAKNIELPNGQTVWRSENFKVLQFANTP